MVKNLSERTGFQDNDCEVILQPQAREALLCQQNYTGKLNDVVFHGSRTQTRQYPLSQPLPNPPHLCINIAFKKQKPSLDSPANGT